MSRTEKLRSERLRLAIGQMQRMIDQGRSFSGRERNCCFLNTADGRFANVSASSGLDFPDDGRGVALVDWDQDGDLDVWISNRNAPRLRFMRNQLPPDRHWMAFRLQGNGTTTNRDGIGARVELVAAGLDGKRSIHTLRAGEGFLSQSSKWLHFGLGRLVRVDRVRVHWPGGAVEDFTGAQVDRRHLLVQGVGVVETLPRPARKLALKPAEQSALPKGNVRVPLVSLLPMPKGMEWDGFDGTSHKLTLNGNPTLIVLWAGWCAPCRAELRELVERQNELRSAGIDVVALAVDGLGDDKADPAAARAVCARLKFPFPAGRARADFVQLITGYHHMLVALTRPLPVPTSLLVDRKGRLSVIYKGRLPVDALLKDARTTPHTLRDRWMRSACFPGRMIDDDRILRTLRRAEAGTFYAIGEWFSKRQMLENAIDHFNAALQIAPNHGKSHLGLAVAFERLKNDKQAELHYTKALKALPDHALPHFGLGNIHLRADRYVEAVSRYRKAIRAQPDFLLAHMNLGTALVRQNRNREAARHFRRALEIDPDFAPARRALNRLGGSGRR